MYKIIENKFSEEEKMMKYGEPLIHIIKNKLWWISPRKVSWLNFISIIIILTLSNMELDLKIWGGSNCSHSQWAGKPTLFLDYFLSWFDTFFVVWTLTYWLLKSSGNLGGKVFKGGYKLRHYIICRNNVIEPIWGGFSHELNWRQCI